jgi:hypothetical protein
MCSQFESGTGSANALVTTGDRGIYELSCWRLAVTGTWVIWSGLALTSEVISGSAS